MSNTLRPPPYGVGKYWTLHTDVSSMGKDIGEISLTHRCGARLVLRNVPKAIWSCNVQIKFASMDWGHMVTSLLEGFELEFLGSREDYLLIIFSYNGNKH